MHTFQHARKMFRVIENANCEICLLCWIALCISFASYVGNFFLCSFCRLPCDVPETSSHVETSADSFLGSEIQHIYMALSICKLRRLCASERLDVENSYCGQSHARVNKICYVLTNKNSFLNRRLITQCLRDSTNVSDVIQNLPKYVTNQIFPFIQCKELHPRQKCFCCLKSKRV